MNLFYVFSSLEPVCVFFFLCEGLTSKRVRITKLSQTDVILIMSLNNQPRKFFYTVIRNIQMKPIYT